MWHRWNCGCFQFRECFIFKCMKSWSWLWSAKRLPGLLLTHASAGVQVIFLPIHERFDAISFKYRYEKPHSELQPAIACVLLSLALIVSCSHTVTQKQPYNHPLALPVRQPHSHCRHDNREANLQWTERARKCTEACFWEARSKCVCDKVVQCSACLHISNYVRV